MTLKQLHSAFEKSRLTEINPMPGRNDQSLVLSEKAHPLECLGTVEPRHAVFKESQPGDFLEFAEFLS